MVNGFAIGWIGKLCVCVYGGVLTCRLSWGTVQVSKYEAIYKIGGPSLETYPITGGLKRS